MAARRDLDGAVVAVIGATGGMGTALTEALRGAGATVVTANRSGGTDVTLDLRDASAGDLLVDHVRAAHGRLDGVVIAAGIVAFGDVADTDDVVLEELLLTNAMGPVWLARRARPLLAESRGFLVNLSGVVAESPVAGMVAYSASKAAASTAFRALAKEWRRDRIDVVDARPPHTETGLADRPLVGAAPSMPTGLDPADVARRVLEAITAGEREVSAADFGRDERAADDPA